MLVLTFSLFVVAILFDSHDNWKIAEGQAIVFVDFSLLEALVKENHIQKTTD